MVSQDLPEKPIRVKIDFVNFHTTIFPSEKIIPDSFQEEIFSQELTNFVRSITTDSFELHPIFDYKLIQQGGAYKYWTIPCHVIELWCRLHDSPVQNYSDLSMRIEITCADKKGTLMLDFAGGPSIRSHFNFEGDKTILSRKYSMSYGYYSLNWTIELSKDDLIKQKDQPVLINISVSRDSKLTFPEDETPYYDYFLFMDRLVKIDKEVGDFSQKVEIVKEFYDREKRSGRIDMVELIREGMKSIELNVERKILDSVKREVWNRDGGKCSKCGSREKLEFDHIIPYSKGGSNTARNIELLCMDCNRKKSNRI
jgi:hypothetical protein